MGIGWEDPRVASVDATWPAHRQATDLHRGWRWSQILEGRPERFAVLDQDDRIVALWCSTAYRLLKLDGASYYRLDYFEIDPQLRGTTFGPLAAGFFASRCVEMDAAGIVFGALPSPGLVAWYKAKLGATDASPKGWIVQPGLVPLLIRRDRADILKEYLDALAQDPT